MAPVTGQALHDLACVLETVCILYNVKVDALKAVVFVVVDKKWKRGQ